MVSTHPLPTPTRSCLPPLAPAAIRWRHCSCLEHENASLKRHQVFSACVVYFCSTLIKVPGRVRFSTQFPSVSAAGGRSAWGSLLTSPWTRNQTVKATPSDALPSSGLHLPKIHTTAPPTGKQTLKTGACEDFSDTNSSTSIPASDCLLPSLPDPSRKPLSLRQLWGAPAIFLQTAIGKVAAVRASQFHLFEGCEGAGCHAVKKMGHWFAFGSFDKHF